MKTSPTASNFSRPRLFFAATIVMSAMLFAAAATAMAGSIFDDDYVPPKRSEPATPPPAVAPTVPPSPSPETPAPPVVRPPDAAPPVRVPAPTAVHRQIPDHATRTKMRKLFEEVYAKELKDHTPAGRRKLGESLLDEAKKNAEGSPDRFVLLTGAIQSAEEGQSLRICFAAAKILSSEYGTDELATKADAIVKAGSGSAPAAFATVSNIEATLNLADQLVEEDDFATAAQVEAVLQRVIGSIPDADLKSDVRNQIREVAAMREATEKVAPAMAKLKQSPEDSAANLAVGSYYCFQRGKWGIGLPLLAKSSDPELKKLAGNELAGLAGADAIADGWYDEAPKLAPADRPKALQHAGVLYRTALAELTGLRKLAVEKRIAQIPRATRARHIDLIELFDSASAVRGNWQVRGGAIVVDPSDFARAGFAYEPPEEYDFVVSFTVEHQKGAVLQILYSAGHQFSFQIGGGKGTMAGFDMVRGKGVMDNKTAKLKKRWLSDGQRYTSVVKVRKTGVEAYLDGQFVTALGADVSDTSLYGDWSLAQPEEVGIGAYQGSIRFDTAEIIEITGEGKRLTK
ncbi:MAG TPA: hypothetical protein VFE47_12000 [Tepidisphaeraceae bacterium]|jgi:hypothetical protein|nr:hypothetical protein [Tepidisphaeraceae bacterium]